jgi:hypothetical protein
MGSSLASEGDRRGGEALFGKYSLSLARRIWPRLAALLEGPLWLVACGEQAVRSRIRLPYSRMPS